MSKATFRASADSKAVAENMQILTGQKGDKLDKALTYREAAAIGLLKLRRSGSGAIIPENPTPPERDPVWQGVEKPHAPVNVTADGAFHTVTLTWDIPTYKGHAFAEVWRAEFDGAVADKGNNIAKAVRVGTTLANVYADAVGKGFKAFYWVRFVNKNGYNGPYQSALGLLAETSRDIQDIIDGLTGQITASHFDKWLQQDYAGVKQDIVSLEEGVGSMWAVKASAGAIKAGIGLVAKSDGTSQVFLAASQVFAYDPNNPASSAPVFAIDQGKVVIQEALIKKAIIQTIHSEKITADYIKAGVSISAPLISGGSFDMGNAYMSGGAAGFGLGGPYSGWGKGWNSIIYSDGSIYTNRLNAEGGNIRDMRMERCVIAESCDVRGTLYADQIVGDVVKVVAINQQPDQTITIPAYRRNRYVVVTGISLVVNGGRMPTGGQGGSGYRDTAGMASCNIWINGHLHSGEISASGQGNRASRSIGHKVIVNAGVPITVRVQYLLDTNGGGSGAMVDTMGAVVMVFQI
ncbi:DUF1983 domain-containing protein [Plesiomonas shigelloides]|uniref:phage tail tip fiber protein n=1 Tax=Plesiomonas shigelloides TaxID=703 RepID=UPI001261E3B2|nr:DUF1983 domain-containing protein [Plesiomonas shigelloides]KAB7697963.1 DUF1983 domain-containing protein [Plesiomonas shigelloides]